MLSLQESHWLPVSIHPGLVLSRTHLPPLTLSVFLPLCHWAGGRALSAPSPDSLTVMLPFPPLHPFFSLCDPAVALGG